MLCATSVSAGAGPSTGPISGRPTSAAAESDAISSGLPDATQPGAELMLFQDMPIVISAARQEQPITESAVSISIISADDIHYGARTTLPEILQFTPGVDVLRIDRNSYAVGVLGLHHTFSDRTLTLIDGRNANSTIFGGTDFLSLPIFNEDIERIEVIRGPGGAAWGANAFNGVVNIITKQPDDVRGFLASSTVDEYGDTYNQFRWAASRDEWTWRVSAGYENRLSSTDALDGNTHLKLDPPAAFLLAGSPTSTNDSAQNVRFDGEAIYHFSDQTKLTLGVANANEKRGTDEFLGTFRSGYSYIDVLRTFARLDYKPDSTQSGYIQLFSNYESLDVPTLAQGISDETDLEGQWNFLSGQSQKVTVGGNIRGMYTNYPHERPSDLLAGSYPEYTGGMFAIDRWQITKPLALEGQIRGDYYSGSGADWSGRLSALYSLDASDHQVLRLSVARAFREPLTGVRELDGSRLPVPGVTPTLTAINFIKNSDLKNEHINAIEAGYDGQLGGGWALRLDTFYNRYESLIGGQDLPDPLNLGRQIVQLQNIGGADSFGAIPQLSYTQKNLSYTAWYSFEHYMSDLTDQSTRSFRPVEHQAGLNVRWTIGDGWTASGNYKFTDTTKSDIGSANDPLATVGPSNQLDLTIAKTLFDNKAELAFGVADLFDQTRTGVGDDGRFTSHDTPGRTVFFRLQSRF